MVLTFLSHENCGLFYNHPACDCNETGSVDNICNPLGGVCLCREGVGGDRCEYCENGFFNFSSNGCQGKPL